LTLVFGGQDIRFGAGEAEAVGQIPSHRFPKGFSLGLGDDLETIVIGFESVVLAWNVEFVASIIVVASIWGRSSATSATTPTTAALQIMLVVVDRQGLFYSPCDHDCPCYLAAVVLVLLQRQIREHRSFLRCGEIFSCGEAAKQQADLK
jgi:hypothetical protein